MENVIPQFSNLYQVRNVVLFTRTYWHQKPPVFNSNGSFLHLKESLGLSTRLNDLLRWMLWQTVSRLVSQHRVSGQFPDTESLMQTGHHLSGPLCLLSICSSVSHISLFPFICPDCLCLSIMAHLNGLTLWLSLSFTISRLLPSFHPSLFGNASKLTLSLSASLYSIHLSRLVCLKGSRWCAVPSRVHRFG